MLWIDYDGNHQPYKLLKPGQRHRQQTYLTHPWTFKTASSREEEHSDDGEDEEVGGRGRGEEEEEEKKRRGKFQLSKRARRGLSFCLPFLIIALVIAGATVFITSDA